MELFGKLPIKTEMIYGISMETRLFLYACVLGAVLGAMFDVLRIFRKTVSHNHVAVFAEDFFFVLFGGLCYYVFITELAWGLLRGFIFIGMVLGMLAEHFTIGNIIVFVLSAIFRFIKLRIVVPTVRFIVRIAIKQPLKFVQYCKFLIKESKRERKRLKDEKTIVYNDGVSV